MRIKKLFYIFVTIFSFITFLILVRSIYLTTITFAPDFSVMWHGASALLNRRNPYIEPDLFTGIGYPPNSLLFYIPLAFLPYKIAQGLFTFLSALAIFVIVSLSFKILDIRRPYLISLMLAFSLIVFSFPTRFTLGMGQNNLLGFLFLIWFYYFYKKKHNVWAAIILGLAISLKTIFGFLLLFFILNREWKIVLTTIFTVFIFVLSTTIFFGANLYLFYLNQVLPPLMNFSGRNIYYNQGFIGFASRIISNVTLLKISNLIFTLINLIVIYFFSFVYKKDNRNLLDLKFSLFIISLLLIDTLSWQHHFVWLIFSFVVFVNYAMKLKKIWIWGLIGISYILVSWNFKNPSLFSNFPLSLILSNVFYGTVILLLLNLYFLKKFHA